LLCPVFHAKRTAMHLSNEFGNLKGQKQKRCSGSKSNSTSSIPVSGFPIVGRNFSPWGNNRRDECPRSVFIRLCVEKKATQKSKIRKKRNIKIYTFFTSFLLFLQFRGVDIKAILCSRARQVGSIHNTSGLIEY